MTFIVSVFVPMLVLVQSKTKCKLNMPECKKVVFTFSFSQCMIFKVKYSHAFTHKGT